MTQEQKVIRAKVGMLELARQLGNVSQACEIKSNVVFGKFGLIRRQAVAEPVCCRSPVVRL